MLLAQAKLKIADAQTLLANGADRERVDAAGELSLLARQRDVLQQRLAEIDRRPDAPETVYQWLKEELFNLRLGIESWIAHG